MITRNVASLTLIGRHPSVRASDATEALLLDPTDYGNAGDNFVSALRQRTFTSNKLRDHTLWTLRRESHALGDAFTGFESLSLLLDVIASKANVIRSLSSKYESSLSWYGESDNSQGNFVLPADLATRVSTLGLDLMCTVYFAND